VLWAAALGLLFSLSGLSELFPSVVSFAALLASVCTPLAMIGLGMSLAEASRSSCRPISGIVLALVLRLAVSPILAVTLTLPFGDRSLSTAMLIAAGVASAGSIPALIRRYGGDHSLAAVCTFASTFCSVATLPLLYSLMTKLV
jgi:predicted permease